MSVSENDGGLPPDSVCEDEDTILAACEAALSAHHDRSHGSHGAHRAGALLAVHA